jgi:flavoprotein
MTLTTIICPQSDKGETMIETQTAVIQKRCKACGAFLVNGKCPVAKSDNIFHKQLVRVHGNT